MDAFTNTQPSMESYAYSAFLPVFDDTHYEPLTPFDHVDPGGRAVQREAEGQDSLAFLSGAQVNHITPSFGNEIIGADLTKFDGDARDQLALLTARRGVLVFRDQKEFLSKNADWLRDWGRHFGR